ncbi:MAG: hypothetical protein Q9166_002114 [cf. Caloplaca sp. 2 TL-2023]
MVHSPSPSGSEAVTAVRLNDMAWEVYLVEQPEVMNASAFATGQIVIWSGIFEAITNDDELAALLGHVIDDHQLEKRSRNLLSATILLPFMPIVFGALYIPFLTKILESPLNLDIKILMMLSRNREKEADWISMLLMTEAGFHPNGAVSFWRNVNRLTEAWRQANPNAHVKPEILSTHPHSLSRIQHSQEWIPEAVGITGRIPLFTVVTDRNCKVIRNKKRNWDELLKRRRQAKRSA